MAGPGVMWRAQAKNGRKGHLLCIVREDAMRVVTETPQESCRRWNSADSLGESTMTTGKHVDQGCATIKVREASVAARVGRYSDMQRALRGEQKEPPCNEPGLSANDISVEWHTTELYDESRQAWRQQNRPSHGDLNLWRLRRTTPPSATQTALHEAALFLSVTSGGLASTQR
ncbi:uncharacterized protein LOC119179667 isoform X1 [Rhipicephalus microplus]|uniref:uncharacterized protein LOC119179667 isoform X1 n=1 Tax=Rhipicephalus microplus TaxID=6941 RepID=UPI003F6CC3F9